MKKNGKLCVTDKKLPPANPGIVIGPGTDEKDLSVDLSNSEVTGGGGGGGSPEGTSIKSTGVPAGKVLSADGEGGASWEDGGSGSTTVIANPTLAGSEDSLIGLQVDNMKYKLDYAPATPLELEGVPGGFIRYTYTGILNPDYEGSAPIYEHDVFESIIQYIVDTLEGPDSEYYRAFVFNVEEYHGSPFIEIKDIFYNSFKFYPYQGYGEFQVYSTIRSKVLVEIPFAIDLEEAFVPRINLKFEGDLNIETDAETGDTRISADNIRLVALQINNRGISDEPGSIDLNDSTYTTWIGSLLTDVGPMTTSLCTYAIGAVIDYTSIEGTTVDIEDMYGNKWTAVATSENTCDLAGKLVNIPGLQGKIFNQSAQAQVEVDGETGDACVTVDLITTKEIGLPTVTSADVGKFLRVDANGDWVVETVAT